MRLFEKFGEMNSYEEINAMAEQLLAEGDLDNLKAMAAENGLAEAVEFFVAEEIPILCDAESAALGKIEVEAAQLQVKGLMVDWVEYIKAQIMEDESVARVVRTTGKNLAGCIAALMDWSFKNSIEVPKEVKDASGIDAVKKTPKITFGVPGMAEARKIIKNYYRWHYGDLL